MACSSCNDKIQKLTLKVDMLTNTVSKLTDDLAYLQLNHISKDDCIARIHCAEFDCNLNKMKLDDLESENRKLEEHFRSLELNVSNLEDTIPLTSFVSDVDSEKIKQLEIEILENRKTLIIVLNF